MNTVSTWIKMSIVTAITIASLLLATAVANVSSFVSVTSSFTRTCSGKVRGSREAAWVFPSASSFSQRQGSCCHSDYHRILLLATKAEGTGGQSASSNINNNGSSKSSKKKKMSRPERKALEREKKRGSNNKNNRQGYQRQYNLHSTKVATLCKSKSTAEDVITAIKRAQNKHDVHDIRNIAKFLLHEVDVSFAYGFRGSLLARLAVAALHMSEHESARRAIEVRKLEYQSSMLPMESAAIIRGLLRVHNVTDAINILEEELPLPPEVRSKLKV
jgi:hypothetical protein